MSLLLGAAPRHRRRTIEPGKMGRFIWLNQIEMDYEEVPKNPNWSGGSFPGQRHFAIRIMKPEGSMLETFYTINSGDEPNLEEVLGTLALDAGAALDFYGDVDGLMDAWEFKSRKEAKRTLRLIEKGALDMKERVPR